MASAPKITLYVDIVSPFAYIAYYVLRHDAVFRNCDITYIPIFLGGLMKKCGNTAPINITNKGKWIVREQRLWANTFDVPMKSSMPPNFPPMTLNAMRRLAVLAGSDGHGEQSQLIRTLDAFFHDMWIEHSDVTDLQVLQSVLERVLGSQVAAEVAAQAGSIGKEALLRNTDTAFETGAFGLPWMVCTNSKGESESFWGVDHLGQVATFLGLPRPTTRAWRAVL